MTLCRLLVFAYVFHHAIEFAQIAWMLFLFHRGPCLDQSSQATLLLGHPLVRHDLLCEDILS